MSWQVSLTACPSCGNQYCVSGYCEFCHIDELDARFAASTGFHSGFSSPRSCTVYSEMHGEDCPCEDNWKEFLHGS